MKVPGIEEMVRTFSDAYFRAPHGSSEAMWGAGLLAVFETHVKGVLVEAYKSGGAGNLGGEHDYANRILAQLKEPRHD